MHEYATIRAFVLTSALAACSTPAKPPLSTTGTNDVVGPVSNGAAGNSGSDAGWSPPSCQGFGDGLTNCGASRDGGATRDSCCTSLEVAGGKYYRTYANDGSGATGEADWTTISSFRLDKYDVTVGRFRRFVNAVLPADGGAGWLPSEGSGKHVHLNSGQGLNKSGAYETETGWLASDNSSVAPTDANLGCNRQSGTWTIRATGNETRPITCVNWYEAYAFCIWDGGFLPSEAEWEYASAGGTQEREYPWGSTPPGTANEYAIYGSLYVPPDGTGSGPAPAGTATLGAGRWGQLDLAGNVSVWNLDWDWFLRYTYPCVDCAYLTASSGRVAGGGDYSADASTLLPTSRQGVLSPSGRGDSLGFRCARTP